MSRLLATKLHHPSIPPKRVQRPHLIQRLNEGLESGRQVTLVSAPAGFGKTTCISEWARALDRPVTWLSLDAEDDDPGRFFTYLVAALQKVNDELGREIQGVLRAGQLPPIEVINTTLINDILDLDSQFLLVLDDFHLIQDRSILEVLEKMVADLPQSLHLVLLTREDPPLPLARLRANNQLTEIRARELRFTRRDAERFRLPGGYRLIGGQDRRLGRRIAARRFVHPRPGRPIQLHCHPERQPPVHSELPHRRSP